MNFLLASGQQRIQNSGPPETERFREWKSDNAAGERGFSTLRFCSSQFSGGEVELKSKKRVNRR